LDYLTKHETWLKLDEEELQRHNSSRDEFLRQCLENYLLSLAASDDHDGNALRFSALWLEHSEDTLANDAVLKYRKDVPSRKFAPLMNQLASRLQNTSVKFQQLLFDLVLQICTEHPYHGMYQIYAGANSRTNPRDESAVSRKTATVKIAERLGKQQTTEQISFGSSPNVLQQVQSPSTNDADRVVRSPRLFQRSSHSSTRTPDDDCIWCQLAKNYHNSW